ncbi:MAG: hypothetical protein ACYSR5_02400 [Planctomycetota bacterium]|jgi:tRNA U34 2-thiouridine synthase MnmA/TrmU
MVCAKAKVFVALSGGVDSSTAAAFYVEDGGNGRIVGGGWIDGADA